MTERPITEDDLHAYVDGRLDEARNTEISTYLERHPEIADRFASYSVQRGELRSFFDTVAEEPVPTRLNLSHLVTASRQKTAFSWRLAAAAVILVFAGASGGWYMHDQMAPAGEGVAALAREASENYATYASDTIRPVELRAEGVPQLLDWASQRMGHKPVVPDLSKSGYRLMGGRVVSTPHGAGLMLMYDNDRGTRLVMLTRPMIVDQTRTMTPHVEGKVGSWSWASNGMGYSLVGSLPSDALHPLADDIRQQLPDRA